MSLRAPRCFAVSWRRAKAGKVSSRCGWRCCRSPRRSILAAHGVRGMASKAWRPRFAHHHAARTKRFAFAPARKQGRRSAGRRIQPAPRRSRRGGGLEAQARSPLGAPPRTRQCGRNHLWLSPGPGFLRPGFGGLPPVSACPSLTRSAWTGPVAGRPVSRAARVRDHDSRPQAPRLAPPSVRHR